MAATMANAEVGVPMGDVVVVTTESSEGDNPEDTKTQVILQLQPVQQGFSSRIFEEAADSGTTVVTVETQCKVEETEDNNTVEISEDTEIAYPITCGDSRAILLWKKFVCPGINVRCVKFNEQLISPKQFVHLAGKATLKDWKRAIRLGGVMLRKMMDSGQLDFYQHDKVCTNTCRSTKFDLLISSARAPVPGQPTALLPAPSSTDGGSTQITVSEENAEDAIEWNSALTAAVAVATEDGSKKEVEEMSEETFMFWKGIADVGLLGEVICNIQKEILELLRGVQQRLSQSSFHITDIAILNNVAQSFGLMDVVKRVLDNRRGQMDPGHESYHNTLSDLERQLEEQKKQMRDQNLNLKRQAFQNVVLMPSSAPKPPKRPRLQRPASATILTPTAQVQQPQYTVISPITIGQMGQSFSLSNIPVATISQQGNPVTVHTLPGGTQILRYATMVSSPKTTSSDTITIHPSSSLALLSSAAIQDSATLANMGAIMSPVELVTVDSALASVVQNVDESSEETQTVIQINPASVSELEAETEAETVTETITEIKTEDKVIEEIEEHQEQLQNVEIVVLEEHHEETEAK
ncbi:glucocorticoid modulatory element-binding protein 1 isoform X2 [Protopterus annectens]|uniref:glucocorticoid modulatory element-binding protein 1 isoform X2 n=1 Tax=Protopterus annectens TaxID=7888 RepID=UPI001CFAA5A2|nr:glucocorticoid modulatory element-binding protein 1 isoform X2 [Protopterus annectens]